MCVRVRIQLYIYIYIYIFISIHDSYNYTLAHYMCMCIHKYLLYLNLLLKLLAQVIPIYLSLYIHSILMHIGN